MSKQSVFEGDQFPLSNGGFAIVVKYDNYYNIDVVTNNGYKTTTNGLRLKSGGIKDPFHRSAHGVGFIGSDRHVDGTESYKSWIGIITRCYNPLYHKKTPTYIDCRVDDAWHNHETFSKWHASNYVEGFCLDKDLILFGNKIYSPETCIFVPPRVNSFFHVKSENLRGLPHGVWGRSNGTYRSGTTKKTFKTIEETQEDYWQGKRQKTNELIVEYPQFEELINNYFIKFKEEHNV